MLSRSLQHALAPIIVASLAIALFSCMDAIMKDLSIAIGAYNAMLWRTLAALLVCGPVFRLRGGRWPSRQTLMLHIWRSLASAISVLLFFWGLIHTPLAQGIALSFIGPLIALILAGIFLKERIGRNSIGGSILAFVGVLIILAGRAGEPQSNGTMAGALAILAAAIFWAFNLVISRRQSLAAGPMEVAFFFNLIAVLLYGAASPWLAVLPASEHWPAIALAAISSTLSIMMLAWAYARTEAQYLIPVEYSGFIWAALLGWFVFGERLMLATILGALLIIAGCLWAARGRTPDDHEPITGPEAAP